MAIKIINFTKLFGNPKIDPKVELTRIKREIDNLKKIECKNVVKFYDAHATKKFAYIFLEYCNGGTLEKYVKDK